MEIPANGEAAFPVGGIDAFPNTTEIVLEELLDRTTPALPQGLRFGQPTWKVGKFVSPTNPVTTVVGSGNPIELYNEVFAQDAAPSQPAPGDGNAGADNAQSDSSSATPKGNSASVPVQETKSGSATTPQQTVTPSQKAPASAESAGDSTSENTLANTGAKAFDLTVLGALALIVGAGLLTLRRYHS